MNKQEIENKVLKIITEQMGINPGSVELKTSRKDIGSDSLDDIEMIMALEEEFAIDLDDAVAERIQTVQDAADVISEAMSA